MIRSSKFKSSIVADVSLTDFISMFNFFTGLDCRSSEDIIISIMKSDGNVVDCIIFDDAVSVVDKMTTVILARCFKVSTFHLPLINCISKRLLSLITHHILSSNSLSVSRWYRSYQRLIHKKW